MTTRRAVLGGSLGAVLAGATGCGGSPRPVQVAVIWSGGELLRFREVLRNYPHPVDVISTRNDVDAFLSARYRAGNQPDVAIVPQISLIPDYAERGWLQRLPAEVAGRFKPDWQAILQFEEQPYGAWVKAAHKSLVWYPPDRIDRPPDTWARFVPFVRELAATGRAPLALGAADGWVLTDWLENLLIGHAGPGRYQGLVTGSEPWDGPLVRKALTELAAVWAIPGVFPDGIGRALITQHEESVMQVVDGRATMVAEGDFVAAVDERFRAATATPLAWARFPAGPQGRPLLVAGDAAMVFAGSSGGVALVEWLTRAPSFEPWIRAGGYLSPNTSIDPAVYGPARLLAQELIGGAPAFDLSDQLRGSLGGPDGLGSWKILQDFLAEVGDGDAVDRAVRRLVRAAAQAEREAGS